ncbi:BZ3500_MvSof-1268-A1-R1_Chr11-3g03590 [Microbotryum saponariae]|uniref:BZ3500_MvSof-1268-A1-R1_Chr11-3g03590 protein n=1 Tax=Microbotryum saponariae TaxID=289078 RepID=A0A2X0KMU1_9BASI|nr:BZ3500_MvSof-1268-A1-R1_Chr11-3g03590 [Microbotryum saponariae]SDA03599.1 BZ3501_MvSof-1269-A2-R1_Chr11g03167 [Microbotryum saponariae]
MNGSSKPLPLPPSSGSTSESKAVPGSTDDIKLSSRASQFDAHDSLLVCIAAKLATTYCLSHRYTQKLSLSDATNETNSQDDNEAVTDGGTRQPESAKKELDSEQVRANQLMRATIADATGWLLDITRQFNVDLNVLPDTPPEEEDGHAQELDQAFRSADSKATEEKARNVAFELVLVSVGLGEHAREELKNKTKSTASSWFSSSSSNRGSSEVPEPNLHYTALSRTLVVRTCQLLAIGEDEVVNAERVISQALYFELQAKQQAKEKGKDGSTTPGGSQEWDQAAQTYRKEQAGRTSALKWGATAAGFVAGGAIIGLTGGLAAPAVAPLLAGTLGISIFAGSGGIILIGTLLGLGGGGLAGYRTHRRMEGLKEVTFEPIVEADVPTIPSLTASSDLPVRSHVSFTVVASGFLLDLNDSTLPWLPAYHRSPTDTYALKVDPQAFLEAGRNYSSWVRDKLVTLGGTEVIKHTALAAVYAGVALPMSIYSGATMVLDSDFTRCREKAKKAGILLAEILEKRVQGTRPVRLMGYGPGATVIFRCLIELHKRSLGDLVYDVILIGLPESPNRISWAAARSVVAHELVNAYSTNDWTLAIHARMYTLSNRVGGLTAVEVEGVRDVEVSDLVQGHLEMREKVDAILKRVRGIKEVGKEGRLG